MAPDNKTQVEEELEVKEINQPPAQPIFTPPPVTPPPSITEFEESPSRLRRWLMIVLFIILAFLVALAVVFAGRWLYNILTDNKKPASNSTNNKVPEAPSTNPGRTTTPTPTPTPPPSRTPAPSPTPSPSGTLPNNGPGDVIAIFFGTAAIAGGLHFLYTFRKQS